MSALGEAVFLATELIPVDERKALEHIMSARVELSRASARLGIEIDDIHRELLAAQAALGRAQRALQEKANAQSMRGQP